MTKDLMAVFELYGGSRQIHLYFDVEQTPNSLEPVLSNVNVSNDLASNVNRAEISKNYEHGSSSRSGKEVDTGPSLLEQMWAGFDSFDDVDWTELGDCQFDDEGDELFDYSDSEDLDWDVNGEGGKSDGGHSSTDSGDGSDIDGGHQTEDSEGGISNYESDDEGGQRSNDENDIQALNADRYMQGKMFEIKEGQKICLICVPTLGVY